MAKLGWVNQHYLKTDDPATLAPPLVWHLEQRGIDVSAGPAPTDVILALTGTRPDTERNGRESRNLVLPITAL